MKRLRRHQDESGVVVIIMAICLPMLVLICGFGVDLGGWYLAASKEQRAADAAALAGVAWMPDTAKATSVALETAKLNGYDDALSTVTVKVEPIEATDLKVTVTDTNVATYFTNIVFKKLDIWRDATATQAPGVHLGNPMNAFGIGDLTTGATQQNAWASISGWCNAKEQGDEISSFRNGNIDSRSSGLTNCNDTSNPVDVNAEYDPNGYIYILHVPGGRSAPLEVLLYDAPWFRSSVVGTGDVIPAPGSLDGPGQVWPADTSGVPTQFTVLKPDNTEFDDTDNALFSPACDRVMEPDDASAFNRTVTVANDPDGSRANRWTSLCTIPAAAPAGDYLLRVNNMPARSAADRKTYGTNTFGIVLQNAGQSVLNICSSETSPTCPQVEPKKFMSIQVEQAGDTASVYLADIAAGHAGKTLGIGLFDPGDGAEYLQLINPAGNPVDFKWNVPGDPVYGGPPQPVSGMKLAVDGTGPKTAPDRYKDWTFNDRRVVLYVTIPTDYPAMVAANGSWWKILYKTAPSSDTSVKTDQTTWSMDALGSPIHLTE